MARIKATFRAGDMVTVKEAEFKSRWGDDLEAVHANFHYTAEDTERWYEEKRKATEEAMAAGEETFSINFDDAGESRLPPRGGRAPLYRGTAYRVLRARCRESFSYYNATGGWTKLLDLNTGREVFYKMHKLEKVTV